MNYLKQQLPSLLVVIGEFQVDIVHVFKEKASKMNSQISFANQLIQNPIECSLKGSSLIGGK